MTCARAGAADAVRALLVRGADVNAKEPTQHQTALMWAAAEQHPKVLQTLIEARADLAAHTKSGFTALHFAARAGDLESVRTLLDAGVDVNIRWQPDPEPDRGAEASGAGQRRRGPGRKRWIRRARRHELSRQHAAARRHRPRPRIARAVPAGSRGGSQRRRCRVHSPPLGSGHVGKRTGESGLRVRRSDRRHSGS